MTYDDQQQQVVFLLEDTDDENDDIDMNCSYVHDEMGMNRSVVPKEDQLPCDNAIVMTVTGNPCTAADITTKMNKSDDLVDTDIEEEEEAENDVNDPTEENDSNSNSNNNGNNIHQNKTTFIIDMTEFDTSSESESESVKHVKSLNRKRKARTTVIASSSSSSSSDDASLYSNNIQQKVTLSTTNQCLLPQQSSSPKTLNPTTTIEMKNDDTKTLITNPPSNATTTTTTTTTSIDSNKTHCTNTTVFDTMMQQSQRKKSPPSTTTRVFTSSSSIFSNNKKNTNKNNNKSVVSLSIRPKETSVTNVTSISTSTPNKDGVNANIVNTAWMQDSSNDNSTKKQSSSPCVIDITTPVRPKNNHVVVTTPAAPISVTTNTTTTPAVAVSAMTPIATTSSIRATKSSSKPTTTSTIPATKPTVHYDANQDSEVHHLHQQYLQQSSMIVPAKAQDHKTKDIHYDDDQASVVNASEVVSVTNATYVELTNQHQKSIQNADKIDNMMIVPTKDELVHQCWTCGVPLHCHPPIAEQHKIVRNNSSTLPSSEASSNDRMEDIDDCNNIKEGDFAINTANDDMEDENDSNENYDSLYAMHIHEVLGNVPQCCVCAELITEYEQQRQQQSASSLLPSMTKSPEKECDDDLDAAKPAVVNYCSGCAVTEDEYEYDFLFCENDGCVRQFCNHCVAKCYGGGETGMKRVENVIKAKSDTDSSWYCPCCVPSTELLYIKQRTTQYYKLELDDDKEEEDKYDNDESNMEAALNVLKKSDSKHRIEKNDLTYLLHELGRAEEEKEHCCEEILSMSNIETVMLEIRQEVITELYQQQQYSQNLVSVEVENERNEVDEMVQVRYREWYDEWDKHERRVSDYITTLLDELEIDHQLTSVMSYQAIGKMPLPPALPGDDGSDRINSAIMSMDNLPMEDWVLAASREIDQRHQERKRLPIQRVFPDIQYEIDDFVDVEDLHEQVDDVDNDYDDSQQQQRLYATDGFASNQPRPSKERVLLAIENEKQLNVHVKCCYSEANDQNLIQEENKNRTLSNGDKIHSLRKSSSSSNRRRNSNSSNKSKASTTKSEKKRVSLQPVLVNDHQSSIHVSSSTQINDGKPVPIPQALSPHLQNADKNPNIPLTNSSVVDGNNPTQLSSNVAEDEEEFYDCRDDSTSATIAPGEEMEQPTNEKNEETAQSETNEVALDVSFDDSLPTGTSLDIMMSHQIVKDMLESVKKGSTHIEIDAKQACSTLLAISPIPKENVDSRTSKTISKDLPSREKKSNITSGKKRISDAMVEPSSIEVISSKRKKSAESKNIELSNVQDPTLVKSLQQQQEKHPPTVLCQLSDDPNKDGLKPLREVRVAKRLWNVLKPHQKDGIKFIWRNTFSDFAYYENGNTAHCGGCILAHNMGLGKSLTTIALLHTVMAVASLIRSVLLVVPVNTIANWENEFIHWQQKLANSVSVYNLSNINAQARELTIKRWVHRGGVLLVSDRTIVNMSGKTWEPDVIVLDEAHTMIKNSATQIYKTLNGIVTPRRILLTGSPIQNNLMEYFHLINFARPNVFGYSSEARFDREYQKPINDGMATNCSASDFLTSEQKERELCKILDPYIQRVDSSELRKHIPPMQHVVIHVRQTKMQSKLYRAYKRYRRKPITNVNFNSFFKQYKSLCPIHNHPASLLFTGTADKAPSKQSAEDADDDLSIGSDTGEWWQGTLNQYSDDQIRHVSNGNKVVILLHILTLAQLKGDKVVIFANNLATLNYLEYVLSSDWKDLVPSLESLVSTSATLGKWQKSRDYVRIDGSVSGTERGTLVDQFEGDHLVKAFLMSKAGGIGINLTKANRIVIFDQHFNPTISLQAIHRLYRYGQKKEVFCYSLLTQGTMEEKIYGRCVNKTGVALRIIDRKTFERRFTAEELQDLLHNFVWVQCDKCEKWRILVNEISDENLPEEWDCSMNDADPYNNSCQKSAKSQAWYEKKYFTDNRDTDVTSGLPLSQQSTSSTTSSPNGKKSSTAISDSQSPTTAGSKGKETADLYKDTILKHLLDVAEVGKKERIICNHYLHDDKLEEV